MLLLVAWKCIFVILQRPDVCEIAHPVFWNMNDIDDSGNTDENTGTSDSDGNDADLDCQPYNTERADVTWETCTLRKWLNNDFYNAAFSVADQDRIITANLSNPDNAIWGTEGGNDTNDKVFCLNVDEIRKYYSFESWDEDYI